MLGFWAGTGSSGSLNWSRSERSAARGSRSAGPPPRSGRRPRLVGRGCLCWSQRQELPPLQPLQHRGRLPAGPSRVKPSPPAPDPAPATRPLLEGRLIVRSHLVPFDVTGKHRTSAACRGKIVTFVARINTDYDETQHKPGKWEVKLAFRDSMVTGECRNRWSSMGDLCGCSGLRSSLAGNQAGQIGGRRPVAAVQCREGQQAARLGVGLDLVATAQSRSASSLLPWRRCSRQA